MKAVAAALAVCTSFLAASVVLAQSRNSDKPAVGATPTYDPAIYAELQKAPEKARNRANPLQNDPDAVTAGAILFEQHCADVMVTLREVARRDRASALPKFKAPRQARFSGS